MAKKRKPGPTPKKSPVYEERKRRSAAAQEEMSRAGREVGGLGFVADPERRIRASRDFRFHCETYHGRTRFGLGWSDDHLTVIEHVQKVTLEGGWFALAMARGSGKSTIVQVAAEWAAINGHHEFVAVIGAKLDLAKQIMEAIGISLAHNEDLAADYPEVAACFRALEGIANRARGQLYGGVQTHIRYSASEIVLPDVKPAGWDERRDHAPFLREDGRSVGSGCILRAAGLTGAVRGMMHARPDGSIARPSLVIVDDPQTDASARSLNQCDTRERLLAGAVMKMGGPDVKMAGVMPCTVIRPGDVADHMLDRTKHPEWNGVRTRMLYDFPARMDLWERYRELRDDGMRCGVGTAAATEFYRDNRAAMDAGARVSWEHRHDPDELSALQHAMNHFFQDEKSFWAEYQNEPKGDAAAESSDLTADDIARKLNRHRRGLVPRHCSRLTAMIDVGADLLFWCVCGWGDGFSGAVIDYGTYPDQGRDYFAKSSPPRPLSAAFPGMGLEAAVYAGLEAAAEHLCGKAWPVDGGGELRVERLLVDANWGQLTDKVYLWARQSKYAGVITPSHGRYVGASMMPFNSTPRKDAQERRGVGWAMPGTQPRAVRFVTFDANHYKSFVYERLRVPMGERGCLSLFGDRPADHRLFADHLKAEYRDPMEALRTGRRCDEWKTRPGRPDNDFFDCLVGCCVAAAVQGVSLLGEPTGQPPAPRPRVSFAELQRRKREGR
jgi:hypothetical protein